TLEAYALLGQMFMRDGRLEQARREFDAIAARGPGQVGARTMVAMILEAQGRSNDAKAAYERILGDAPAAGVAANNLAWLYIKDGRLDDAARLAAVAQRALGCMPQAADT